MAPNRGPQVMAVIPAHNESARISIAIKSLLSQQTPPESIVVLADNCTDATAEVARDMGAQVFKTEGNQHKKAGALNQLLGSVLPGLDEDDRVLIMDADTELAPEFLYVANGRLDSFAELGAVGGIFYGEPGSGLVGLLQRNEYLRYGRDINRHPNRVMVLTGTASLLRVKALREVAAARGSRLPGRPGTVYDTAALTEDNEITLALKTIGWKLVSPRQCRVTTEVMPTWRALWRQRQRWQRGAVENLRHYGWTKTTRRYWGQQALIMLGILLLQLYVWLTVISVLATGSFRVNPYWLSIGGIFVLERLVTVWRGRWTNRIVALPLVIEIGYDLFLQVSYICSLIKIATRRQARWHHVAIEGGCN